MRPRGRFSTILKIVGWCFAIFLVLIVASGAALYFGGGKALAWVIAHPLSSMVGRQITVAGPLTVHWGAPTRVVLEGVHVANAGWSQDHEMFSAKRVEIRIFARTLLHGPVRMPMIGLDGARLLLDTSDQGDKNWDFGLKAAAPQKRPQYPDLERLVVKNSTLVYRNGVTKAENDLNVAQLELDAPNPTASIKLAGKGAFKGAPVVIDATVAPLAELRDTSKPYKVKLDATVDQTQLVVEGTIAEPLDFNGLDLRFSMNGKRLDKIADLLGVPLPELPDFRGTSRLSGGDGNWKLDALSIKLGQSDLEGGLALDTNARVPHVEANLTASRIDLADFAGVLGGHPERSSARPPSKKAAPGDRIFPDTPINVHKLPGINVDLSFDAARIDSIIAGSVPVERVSLGLQINNGRLVIRPLRFHTAKGDVDLNLQFDPFTTNAPPHLAGTIDVRHIDLHELLSGPKMPDIVKRTAGTVGGFVKLDTNGATLREFLARMNGDAGFFMQNGEVSDLLQRLAPIDVLGALGVYLSGDQPVPINCLVSRFDIKQGIATATTLLIDTNDTRIAGSGNINFADETIVLSLTPTNKHLTAVSLRTPVDIRGTLGKPGYHLRTGNIVARLGAAVGLGVLFPPAALLPLIDTGLGEKNACSAAFAAQRPPGNSEPKTTPVPSD
jgi:uncharacterized protein involved in outer membrane biogenesis